MGQIIEFASNGRTARYLSVPESGHGPGVIVIQEWWAWSSTSRTSATASPSRLRGAGAGSLPGQSTTEPDEAAKEMMALELDGRRGHERGGRRAAAPGRRDQVGSSDSAWVGDSPSCSPVSALTRSQRWCRATASSRGPTPNPTTRCCQLPPHPVRGRGRLVHARAGSRAGQRPASLGKDAEVIVHPGAEHAFFNDDRPEVYQRGGAAVVELVARLLRAAPGG